MNLVDTKSIITSVITLTLLIFCTSVANAQNKEQKSSDLKQLQDQFKKEYLSFGVLVQSIGDYQPERISGNNGFSVSKARFKVSGELEQRFGYKLQASITSSPSVVDANVYYKLNSQTTVTAGFYKSPFSYEYLTGAASINFVNRSTVVNQLAPKRQVGVQIDGATLSGVLRYTAGIFNGNHFNKNNDDKFLYVGRLEADLAKGNNPRDSFLLGLNGSYEQKNVAASSGNIQSSFQGEQTLLGSYLTISKKRWMLSGELIYSWLKSNTEETEYNPYGYYASVGYFATPQTQVLVRWDSFTGDQLAMNSESIIAGVNIRPSSFSKIKLNYVIPTEQSIDKSQILAGVQIGF